MCRPKASFSCCVAFQGAPSHGRSVPRSLSHHGYSARVPKLPVKSCDKHIVWFRTRWNATRETGTSPRSLLLIPNLSAMHQLRIRHALIEFKLFTEQPSLLQNSIPLCSLLPDLHPCCSYWWTADFCQVWPQCLIPTRRRKVAWATDKTQWAFQTCYPDRLLCAVPIVLFGTRTCECDKFGWGGGVAGPTPPHPQDQRALAGSLARRVVQGLF